MIDLYTAATPNGRKVSIALEETGLPYELHALDLSKGEQKTDKYRRLNLNSRIPTIVDRDENDFALAESGAILIYLAEKSGQFLPAEPQARYQALQWLMFQMSGVGPMMGQAFTFLHYFPEQVPAAIERYQNESRRLMQVINARLGQAAFLAGDEYGIADMATYPWIVRADKIGVATGGLPHLSRWLRTIGDRPAVQRGMDLPPIPSDEERIRRASTIVTR